MNKYKELRHRYKELGECNGKEVRERIEYLRGSETDWFGKWRCLVILGLEIRKRGWDYGFKSRRVKEVDLCKMWRVT